MIDDFNTDAIHSLSDKDIMGACYPVTPDEMLHVSIFERAHRKHLWEEAKFGQTFCSSHSSGPFRFYYLHFNQVPTAQRFPLMQAATLAAVL